MKEKLTQLVIDSIVTRTEFQLLDRFHHEYFKVPCTMEYYNHSLDHYNAGKKYHNVIEATKSSLISTLELMTHDYIVEQRAIAQFEDDEE